MEKRATKDMTIAEVLELDAGVANILFGAGIHCLGCALASGETIGEAAEVHGVNPDELEQSINEYLASK